MRWGDPSLSEILLGGYLGMLTLLWVGLVAGVGSWRKQNRLPAVSPPAEPLPPLTICIPARNEARNIAACVRAALAQDHPALEVVVVDDGSSDGTGDLARAAGEGDRRLHVIPGTELPKGWAGKPWACLRAAGEASGRHLLFIDADVVLAPTAARLAAEVLLAKRLSMLSLFGTWRLDSFWELVAIPVIGWFVRGATDVRAVNTPSRPEAFANGQFILVEREAYDAVSGHEAVKAEVLDDVRLARAFKQQGHPLGLYFAPELFAVRLYTSLAEIVAGYTKNFYEGMDRRPLVALSALVFLVICALLPWVCLAAALLRPSVVLTGIPVAWPWTAWIALVCALPMLLRWRIDRADGRSGALFWTHPLGNLVLGWVLLRAMFTVETRWKGRVFHDGKAA